MTVDRYPHSQAAKAAALEAEAKARDEAAGVPLPPKPQTLRDWYLESANAEPPEDQLAMVARARIGELRAYEDECHQFMGQVQHVLGLIEKIEAQHMEVQPISAISASPAPSLVPPTTDR